MTSKDLEKRLKGFALRLLPLCEALPNKKICKIAEGQLLRSGFSAAANYRSSCDAQSKKSFTAKRSIALEEMDESMFWLEIIDELHLSKHDKLSLILVEALELTKIPGAARRTSSKTIKN